MKRREGGKRGLSEAKCLNSNVAEARQMCWIKTNIAYSSKEGNVVNMKTVVTSSSLPYDFSKNKLHKMLLVTSVV